MNPLTWTDKPPSPRTLLVIALGMFLTLAVGGFSWTMAAALAAGGSLLLAGGWLWGREGRGDPTAVLSRTRQEMQQAYDHMEQQAEARTRKLAQTNRKLRKEVRRHRRTLKLLESSEQRFRELARLAPVGIFTLDLDGRFRFVNERWAKLTGLAVEAVLEQPWSISLGEEDREHLVLEWRRALEHGLPFRFEYRYPSPGRDSIWVICQCAPELNGEGRVIGTVGTLTDISDLKQAEVVTAMVAEALRQAAEMVTITDGDGRIRYVNPAFETITGYRLDEVLGKPVSMLKSGRHEPAFFHEMWETLRQGRTWQGHIINRKKDGELYESETSIAPIQGMGEERHFVSVARDVTREVLLEHQLRQSRKLEAIGTLAGGIAHDFNNLLTPILGFTDLMLEEFSPESLHHRNLSLVMHAANRARELVAQILTFSRQGEQAPRAIDLAPIIKESIKLLRSSLPATIRILTNLDPQCGRVFADPTRLHQVVMNLCANAGHALRERGGELEVRLERQAEGESSWVALTVRDNGCGMEPAVLERVFDPFFTTRVAGEGTGLGLSVVHGIVKGCGGRIQVESQPGEGSTFRVLLPELGEEPREVAEPDGAPLPRGAGRLLVVDDEPMVAAVVGEMLTRLGYVPELENDPQVAWQRFAADPEGYDLLLTDQTMPGLTGLELAGKALALRPGLPVLLVTGYSDVVNDEVMTGLGAAKLLMKPLTPRTLALTLRELLGQNSESRI